MANINKYQHRYHIILLVDNGFYTASKAAQELGLSERQVRNLLRRYRQGQKKFSSLMPQPRPSPWNGVTRTIINEIIRLKKENAGRSNQYIAEIVEEKFDKKVSRETVRRALIKNDCYQKAKRERRVFQKLEKKITHCGQMVQFDTCEGAWLKGYRRVYLIAFMDAYSRYIVGWNWVNSDNAWNNICVLRSIVRKYGVPSMFYADNASFFKVIRHNKSIYQKHGPEDQYETTIQRIILDLGSVMVNHKPYQPQGKGRLERFFRFMQDRFIAEHAAMNLKELNQQFKKWITWYNTKHVIRTTGCVPKDRFDPQGFKPVPEDLVFEQVFSYRFIRKIDKYNSFSFNGDQYIIDPKNCKEWTGCLTACVVDLYVTPQTITVYHHDKRIQRFKNRSKRIR